MKDKEKVTRAPLKPDGELWWSGMVSNSCSTNGSRRYTLKGLVKKNPILLQVT